MKTTIELPDDILRRTKMLAAEQGTSMKSLIVYGLERVLADLEHDSGVAPWMKTFGGMASRSGETEKINADIEAAFEQVDPDLWS